MKYSTVPMRVETASSGSTAGCFSLFFPDLNKFQGIFPCLLWSIQSLCVVLFWANKKAQILQYSAVKYDSVKELH